MFRVRIAYLLTQRVQVGYKLFKKLAGRISSMPLGSPLAAERLEKFFNLQVSKTSESHYSHAKNEFSIRESTFQLKPVVLLKIPSEIRLVNRSSLLPF